MLTELVHSNRMLFLNLANFWLESGAASFSVWVGEQQIDCWTAESSGVSKETLRAEVNVNGRAVGALEVTGEGLSAAANRLQIDADLISGLAARENDISMMASELINTRDQLIALYDLTQQKWTSLDLGRTLEYLSQATASLTRAEAAFVALQLESDPYRYAFSRAEAFEWPAILNNIAAINQVESQYLITGENPSAQVDDGPHNVLLKFQVRGADSAIIGIRTSVSHASLSPVIKLLRTIAEYTGSRIENLLMVQESVELAKLHTEMELARNVQASLLPERTPIVPGLDIWAVSQPASFVGGDFYDIIYEPDRPLTFTVCDISGKGFPASIPMAMARILVRCYVREFPQFTTNAILTSINAELYCDFNRLGIFATIFACQYNPSLGSLVYSNAGHSPVIFCPAQGCPRLLKADGIPLGMLPDSVYADNQLQLEEGDVLVIGSDAFYEAFNAEEQIFTLSRLINEVKALSHLPPEEIGAGLIKAVKTFQGDKAQEDDQTLIIIKRTQSKSGMLET
jgi:phosphoserine phosphatase RsbU/P